VTYRERQRLADIQAAIDAVRSHRYFDTDHLVLQATVDDDLPELERAVHALAETLPAETKNATGPAGNRVSDRSASARPRY